MSTKDTFAAALAPLIATGLIACGSTAAGGGDGGGSSPAAGWCYLTGAAAGACTQSIAFSPSGAPAAGVTVWIACPVASDGGVQGDAGGQPEFVSSLGSVGNGTCLPADLPVSASGMTTCTLLEVLPGAGGESSCNGAAGLSAPDANTLATVRDRASLSSTTPVCEIAQLAASSTVAASCASAAQ
jgi:hypothetical protein